MMKRDDESHMIFDSVQICAEVQVGDASFKRNQKMMSILWVFQLKAGVLSCSKIGKQLI